MDAQKKQILIVVFVLIIWIMIIYFWLSKTSQKEIIIDSENINTTIIQTGGVEVVTTPLPDNFEDKLKQEWRITEIDLSFNKDWFFDKSNFRLNLRSNIKIHIDAGNTWLPDGTILTLDIPWADFQSSISIPGRYKYSIFFKQWWSQKINIYWNGLSQSISKTVTVR